MPTPQVGGDCCCVAGDVSKCAGTSWCVCAGVCALVWLSVMLLGANSSYTAVLVTTDNSGLFANTTGGWWWWSCRLWPHVCSHPVWPCPVPYYVHTSWPGMAPCEQHVFEPQLLWVHAAVVHTVLQALAPHTKPPCPALLLCCTTTLGSSATHASAVYTILHVLRLQALAPRMQPPCPALPLCHIMSTPAGLAWRCATSQHSS